MTALPRLTVEQRRARLAHRHRLAPACRSDDVAQIADDLVALHSSDPVSVYLSLWARMRSPSVTLVDQALYEDRRLVRHHAMRRTLWVATPDLVRLMNASATRKLVGPERRRTLSLLADNGVEDPEGWLAAARQQVVTTLRERGPMTARALGQHVPALRQPILMSPGKKYSVTVSAHTRVLLLLGFEGAVVRTRPAGTWINGQYAWAPAEDWVPGGLGDLDERKAAAELAERWLRAFGPATTEDLQWWTGWTLALTRQALADCGAQEVRLDAGSGWVAAGDLADVPETAPWVALLPGLDPTVMGWKRREWYLAEACGDVFDRNGNAGPTIWADGRVVGAWAQAPDGEIRTRLLVDLGVEHRAAVGAEAERLREWLGETRFSTRFPGQVHRALLAERLA